MTIFAGSRNPMGGTPAWRRVA